jgi:hypothetical protein
MLTDTTFKTLTLSLATYVMFFSYTLTRNPILECFLTVLLMVNLSVLTYTTSQKDFKEAYFRQEIYDDAPTKGGDELLHGSEDVSDSECECENEEAEAEIEAAKEAVTLSQEELAKLNLALTVDNEPPPFSVRALVRAFDNKSPTNAADISSGPITPLAPCSHSTDISGSNVYMSDAL